MSHHHLLAALFSAYVVTTWLVWVARNPHLTLSWMLWRGCKDYDDAVASAVSWANLILTISFAALLISHV